MLVSSNDSVEPDQPTLKLASEEPLTTSHFVGGPAAGEVFVATALLDDTSIHLPPIASLTMAAKVDMSGMPLAVSAGSENDEGKVAEVLADVLTGGAGSMPSIDQLLSNLPSSPTLVPDLQTLIEGIHTVNATEVQFPHIFIDILTEMISHGHDAGTALV